MEIAKNGPHYSCEEKTDTSQSKSVTALIHQKSSPAAQNDMEVAH